MARQMVSYADFRGGLNVDTANDIMADNELTIADNVDLLDRGALTKRAGLTQFNATPYKVGGVDQQILQLIAWDGQLFAVHTQAGWDDMRSFSLVTTTELTPIVSYDLLRAQVAGRKLLVYNNTKSDVGVYPGTVMPAKFYEIARTSAAYEAPAYKAYDMFVTAGKPTVTKSGTGSLTAGLYVCVVKFVNELGYESVWTDAVAGNNHVNVTIDAGATAQSFAWSGIPLGPAGTVSRRLYRSGPLGMTSDPGYLRWNFDLHLVTTLEDNTTTTYTDTTVTAFLTTKPKMERNNILEGKAGTAAHYVWHPASGRYFASGVPNMESAILYSEPMRIDYWKSTSIMYGMGKESATPELVAFGDAVLALYPDSVYAWRGTDSMDATWEQIALPCNSVSSPTLTPESATFVADNGVWAIPQSGYRGNLALIPGADKAMNLAEGKVRSLIRELQTKQATFSPLFDSKEGRYMLRYKWGVAPYTAGVLVYDWSLQAWTHYTGWDCTTWAKGHDGVIYLATGGQIRKVNAAALSDDGTAIPVKVRTKGYDLGIPTWKWVQQMLASFGQHATLTSTINGSVDTGYDTLTIPEFTWAADGDLKQKRIPVHKKGQRFAVEFTHNAVDEPFALYGLSFVMQELPPRGLA